MYSPAESGFLLRGSAVDESAYAAAPALFGGAQWVAGADPFGGAALHPNGGYMVLPRNPCTTTRTADWTFEAWVKPTSSADAEIVNINKSAASGRSAASIAIVGGGAGVVVGNDWQWVNTSTYFGGTVPLNVWTYLEFTRIAGYMKAAINATDVVSYWVGNSDLITDGSGGCIFGINDAAGLPMRFQGLLGPMRLTYGVALRGTGGPLPVPTANFEPLRPPTRSAPSRIFIGHSAPLVAPGARHSRIQMARDMEFGGTGTLKVDTSIKGAPANTPTRARVSILRQRDKALARVAWSGADGKLSVPGLDLKNQQFIALAEYPGNPADPTAEGYMRPMAGVSELEAS